MSLALNKQRLFDLSDISALKAQAALLARIRAFFAQRDVWEISTPLLCQSTATDPQIQSFQVVPVGGGHPAGYLQTSPEFAMKKALAAGSGSIFQISKAFRAGESGRLHRAEFTMLEWYRVGFDRVDLIDEVDDFLAQMIGAPPAERLTYQAVFERYLGINPHQATVADLMDCAHRHIQGALPEASSDDKDYWLALLFSHRIEPHLGGVAPTCVYHFPASQAALSKIVTRQGIEVAERFEFYVHGIELANGYHELTDATEQRQRFEQDLKTRRAQNLPPLPMDEVLLAALEKGMPACAGVALGVDRLLLCMPSLPIPCI